METGEQHTSELGEADSEILPGRNKKCLLVIRVVHQWNAGFFESQQKIIKWKISQSPKKKVLS